MIVFQFLGNIYVCNRYYLSLKTEIGIWKPVIIYLFFLASNLIGLVQTVLGFYGKNGYGQGLAARWL
ncbi:hypothetical protein L6452_15085 [Arctium lappa]|uniref:Uncharacterized protein n=1 Tax=Arctium lappa TaxID=4217 RepID=A0ACB9CMR7_ARCLA|nr:hypothetical protein L6452_15085 [Arctium lappa]